MILCAVNVLKNGRCSGFSYFARNYGQFTDCVLSRKPPNLKIPQTCWANRRIYTSNSLLARLFVDRENLHAYEIIKNLQLCDLQNTFESTHSSSEKAVTDEESFNKLLDHSWRKRTASEILAAFKMALNYARENEISVSDVRFDKLTDGLMDNVEKLSDDEIAELLDVLCHYPPCESFQSHNFHDIWSALDDVCYDRMQEWDRDRMFGIAEKWYHLGLAKIGEYVYYVLDKSTRHLKSFTKDDVVRVFFLINACRKYKIDFEYQSAVERTIGEMSLDEIAVVALGFFKTQSRIKIPEICSTMLRKVAEYDGEIHDITLCAVIKIVRYSSQPAVARQMYELLEYLTPKLNRYSTLCLLHVGLFGTTLQIEHKPSLKVVAQRIAKEAHLIEKVRLKEIERMLLPLAMFDYDPQTNPDIFEIAQNELRREERLPELTRFPKCLVSAVHYLSVRKVFCYDLMDKILNKEFVSEVFGRVSRMHPRELMSLDVTCEIECSDYKGSRLEPKYRQILAKFHTDYFPNPEYKAKFSAADKLILDVAENVSAICGGKEFMCYEHVLPNYTKADIIICKDNKSGSFVKPTGLEKYTLGDIMRPPDENGLTWYAIVVTGWNSTVRNTLRAVGEMNMKYRQLTKIGYKPVPVIWSEYLNLSRRDKLDYILDKL